MSTSNNTIREKIEKILKPKVYLTNTTHAKFTRSAVPYNRELFDAIESLIQQEVREAQIRMLVSTCLGGMGGLTPKQQEYIEDCINELQKGGK